MVFHHFPRCNLESLFSGGATYSDIIYRTGCSLPVGWCKEVGPGRGAAKKCTALMWRSVNTVAGLSWLQSRWNNGVAVLETNPRRPYRCSNGDCLLTNLFKRWIPAVETLALLATIPIKIWITAPAQGDTKDRQHIQTLFCLLTDLTCFSGSAVYILSILFCPILLQDGICTFHTCTNLEDTVNILMRGFKKCFVPVGSLWFEMGNPRTTCPCSVKIVEYCWKRAMGWDWDFWLLITHIWHLKNKIKTWNGTVGMNC